ncbi:hypothetical protein [Pseudomonas sp. 28 E 9]|nr:hypothetical protein [Pseudomonas sp. 28 E 9]
MDWVHIRFCGHGCYGFRFYSGSLLKSAKVSKTLLPHHSAPRLGSVCPNAGLNPWAAAMGHPWPSAANPASCRVAHGFKPAFGQRGLTGRLRSRSKARSRATRCASWLRVGAAALCRSELAREKLTGAALIQEARVIVDVFREQELGAPLAPTKGGVRLTDWHSAQAPSRRACARLLAFRPASARTCRIGNRQTLGGSPARCSSRTGRGRRWARQSARR